MTQYMLVLRDDPASLKNLSPEQWQGLLEKYNAWTGRMAQEGRLVAGHKLTDEGGRTLKLEKGKVVVKDGPFGETKEIVGGYFILKANDYDHVVRLCQDHPQFAINGVVEIREVDFMGAPEQ
jgi:hypothetical protein